MQTNDFMGPVKPVMGQQIRRIRGARLALSPGRVEAATLCCDEQGRIARLDPPTEENGPGSDLDLTGCTLLPGFIDVHIHGSGGADVMDATPQALERLSAFLPRHGVTGFYATTMTAPPPATLAAVEAVTAYQTLHTSPVASRILGIHLEGPFISPQYPGAQHPDNIRPPDLAEFSRLLAAGPVKLITLAPEAPGGMDLIRRAWEAGVRVVMGHTAATYAQAVQSIEAGASQTTHTFNAMTGLHHREPGVVGAALSDDRLYAQVIADNIHVHPAAMKILFRSKGAGRTLLITDAVRAAGMPPGEYELGGQAIFVQQGEARLADGTLAGSVLTMDQGLRNLMAATGCDLAQIWPVTSLTPAQALGIDHEFGRIAPGYWADLVALSPDHQVVATVIRGRLAYWAGKG